MVRQKHTAGLVGLDMVHSRAGWVAKWYTAGLVGLDMVHSRAGWIRYGTQQNWLD